MVSMSPTQSQIFELQMFFFSIFAWAKSQVKNLMKSSAEKVITMALVLYIQRQLKNSRFRISRISRAEDFEPVAKYNYKLFS